MTGRIGAIAWNTFREAVRNKILYGVMVVVVAANFMALVLGEMSLHEETRVAIDVGLGGMSLFGAITAIVLGVTLLYAEVQKKTIHVLLAKPIERHEVVAGKYLGMAITLTLLAALFAFFLGVLLVVANSMQPAEPARWTQALTRAVVLAYMETLVVAAIAVFFSAFTTPFLSGIFSFALFALGQTSDEIRGAVERAKDPVVRGVARAALRVAPDLHLFSISGGEVAGQHVSVHGPFVGWGYVGHAGLVALAWIVGLLGAAMLIFRRRDFV